MRLPTSPMNGGHYKVKRAFDMADVERVKRYMGFENWALSLIEQPT